MEQEIQTYLLSAPAMLKFAAQYFVDMSLSVFMLWSGLDQLPYVTQVA